MHREVRVRFGQLTLVVVAWLVLGGCAIPFGNGGDPSYQSPQETRQERRRLYTEEQERMERERTFDRVGPPTDH
jgi:hypothetical protein